MGQVRRMSGSGIQRQIMDSKMGGKRKRDRPNERCRDVLTQYIKK